MLALGGTAWLLSHWDGWQRGDGQPNAGPPRKTRVARVEEKAAAVMPGPEAGAAAEETATDGKTWDWPRALEAVKEQSMGIGDFAEANRLRERIQAMEKSKILATLDEIQRLDLPRNSKAQLEHLFVDPLAQKDAAAAFDRFGDRMEENTGIRHALKRGLETIAKEDPAAALALMDREIAKGTFEVKTLSQTSASRVELERVLAGILIDSDPSQLAARIVNMGEDEAFSLLRSDVHLRLTEDEWPAFANILRQGLPPDKQAVAFVEQALPSGDDYARVSRLLQATGAGEDEARRVAEQVGKVRLEYLAGERKLTAETVDAYRQWAAPLAPGSIDRLTGAALRKAVTENRMGFGQAAEIALHCQESGGSDELLTVFLTAKGRFPKEAAREVAARIKDPQQRAKIISYYP